MRVKSKLLALSLAAALQPAVAGTVTLNFEEPSLWDLDWSKTAGLSNEIGGFSFSGNAWAVVANRGNDDKGDPICPTDTDWTGPADLGCGALMLASSPANPSPKDSLSLTIQVTSGFVDKLMFDFSLLASPNGDGLLEILSETGAVLGQANLGGTDCQDYRICNWNTKQTVKFSDTAYALRVTAFDQNLLLDNLSFITPSAGGNPLPEPGSVALALGALGALGWVRRRQPAR